MIRVVLDMNVLVSGVITPAGPNAQLLDLVAAGKIRPYLTGARTKCQRQSKVFRTLEISKDEDDNRVYECAFAAKAHDIPPQLLKLLQY